MFLNVDQFYLDTSYFIKSINTNFNKILKKCWDRSVCDLRLLRRKKDINCFY